MTAPTVVARTSSEQATDASSFTVGLGGPSAGELIIAIIAIDGVSNEKWAVETTASGKNWWTAAHVLDSFSVVGMVAIKIADGGDALVIRPGTDNGANQQASAITFRISGHGSYVAVSSATGSSTNGDPPNVAITGAAQDCRFIAALCTDAQVVASAAPATYGTLTTKAATTSSGASVSVADKAANASSDNPATFTNTTEQWVAFTIAIPENNITTAARTTQIASEAVSVPDPNLDVTQVALEAITANSLNMIATQVALETLTPQTDGLYATQVALEVISIRDLAVITQAALEVLSGDPWPSLSNANKYRQIQIAC
jgi:hypothetical protein